MSSSGTIATESSKETESTSVPVASRSKNVRKAAFVTALSAFALVNFYVANQHLNTADPDRFAYHGWSWWTHHDLKSFKTPPNVILLGSSLIVAAVAECDANLHKKNLDMAYHRSADYLDLALKAALPDSKLTCANLAAPGQNPTDAYLVLKDALEQGIKPNLVVYGIAPRDFLDGTMQSPSSTEPFQYFHRLVNLQDCLSDFYTTPENQLDLKLHQTIPLYEKGSVYKLTAAEAFEKAITENTSLEQPQSFDTELVLEPKVRAEIKPYDIKPNTSFAMPTITTPKDFHVDNRDDYRARYKKPDKKIYDTQFKFVRRIAQLCQEHKVPLVLINMPITPKISELLKPAVYGKYLQDVRSTATDFPGTVTFLDMSDFTKYTWSDYKDLVHLNGNGGKKFLDNLVNELLRREKLKSALTGEPPAAPTAQR